ncbi:hypothetical protein [Cerasicoccus fimbriatus]|uniref:hypothetical protein n=1 Tax=Cerasicoccus fimbriatus TaxID=3014554 RepID=UPI0022B5B765|nr:hypothetical protein [Cerasicoccus sp. TK19100]
MFVIDLRFLNERMIQYSEDYLEESIGLAATTYAVSRVVNGGVSMLQESSVAITPFGLGLETEPGQLLDPINDATERLSDLCVYSIGLMGVQRIALEVVNEYTIILFYGAVALGFMVICFTRWNNLSVFLNKLIILFVLLRISTPFMCFIGQFADNKYFQPQIEESIDGLSKVQEILAEDYVFEETEFDIDFNSDGETSALEAVKLFFLEMTTAAKRQFKKIQFIGEKTGDSINYIRTNEGSIALNLTELFAAIFGKIVVQVFLIPLATLVIIRWVFKQVSGASLNALILNCRKYLTKENDQRNISNA